MIKGEDLITEFALYCMKYKDYSMEACIKAFYNSSTEEEKEFFRGHWELCIGSAEALRNTKEDLQQDIIELSR